MKSFKNTILINLLILILLLPFSEFVLRSLNYKPYTTLISKAESSPKNCVGLKKGIGFCLLPGKFNCTINNKLSYYAEHGEDSFRATYNIIEKKSLPVIILTGCSFTYGMGVDNNYTYPYITDSVVKNYKIKNHGGLGFGTVQTFLEVKGIIEQYSQKPKVIIYNYMSFHNERNTMNSSFRSIIFDGLNSNMQAHKISKANVLFPYINDKEKPLNIKFLTYNDFSRKEFPLKRISAIANLLSKIKLHLEEKSTPSICITESILAETAKLCKKNNIDFYVSHLEDASTITDIVQFCKSQQIKMIDLSINMQDPENFNLPVDSHPSRKGHAAIAAKLIRFINSTIH